MKHLYCVLAWLCVTFATAAETVNTDILKYGTLEELEVGKSLVVTSDPTGTALVDKWNLVIKDKSTGIGIISNEIVHGGSKAIKVELNNITARYHFFLAQELKNVSPANYTFSFWVKPSIANVPIRVEAIAGSIDLITPKSVTPTTTEWQKITVPLDLTGKSPGDLAVVRFVVRMNCTSGGGVDKTNIPITYYFDDFSCIGEISDVVLFAPEPYLQSKTENGILINWFSAVGEEGIPTVEYGTTDFANTTQGSVKSIGSMRWSGVQLSSLTPDTEYQFRCRINSNVSKTYKFRTLPAKDTKRIIRFLSFGDSHEASSITTIRKSAIAKLKELYGDDIHNYIDFIVSTGDIVQGWGESESDFVTAHFTPNKDLSATLPTYIAAGNHDYEKNDSQRSFFYDFMDYTSLSDAKGDAKGKYYSQQIGNSLFLYLNSNQQYLCDAISTNNTYQQNTTEQLDWLKEKLVAAETDATIDLIFVFAHHGYRNEMWSDPSQDAIVHKVNDRLYPVFEHSTKIKEFQYGHTHATERGVLELKNGQSIVLFQNGNSGSFPDYFGRYKEYVDYPEIHRQSEFAGFAITEIAPAGRSYVTQYYGVTQRRPVGESTATTYVRTNSPAASEDTWGQTNTAERPKKPSIKSITYDNNQLLVTASPAEEMMSVHYQITNSTTNTLVKDTIIHHENIFGVTGYFTLSDGKIDLSKSYLPIDLNTNVKLNQLATTLPAGEYSARLRYRDMNYNWGDFSQEEISSNNTAEKNLEKPSIIGRNGKLHITSTGGNIEIYSAAGFKLKEKTILSGEEVIDVTGNTFVLVRFENEKIKINEKIIVQ